MSTQMNRKILVLNQIDRIKLANTTKKPQKYVESLRWSPDKSQISMCPKKNKHRIGPIFFC